MPESASLPRPVVLAGAAVRLEPLDPRHLEGLAAAGADASIFTWMPADLSRPGRMARYVELALAERDRGESFAFAIVAAAGGAVIGSTRYMALAPAHRRLEIGSSWLAPAHQRTAANTEAKLLLLAQAFEVLGYRRVEFKTDALNGRSRTALRRLGAAEEGTLRNHMVMEDGRVRNSVYYSILFEEWPALKAALRRRLGLPASA